MAARTPYAGTPAVLIGGVALLDRLHQLFTDGSWLRKAPMRVQICSAARASARSLPPSAASSVSVKNGNYGKSRSSNARRRGSTDWRPGLWPAEPCSSVMIVLAATAASHWRSRPPSPISSGDPDNAKVPLQGAFIPSAEYALLPNRGPWVSAYLCTCLHAAGQKNYVSSAH
jgi:hypothetical protein